MFGKIKELNEKLNRALERIDDLEKYVKLLEQQDSIRIVQERINKEFCEKLGLTAVITPYQNIPNCDRFVLTIYDEDKIVYKKIGVFWEIKDLYAADSTGLSDLDRAINSYLWLKRNTEEEKNNKTVIGISLT